MTSPTFQPTAATPGEGLPPPRDMKAEASVLGAVMYDSRWLARLPADLTHEDFYSEAHRRIFEAIDELRADKQATDAPRVEQALRSKKRLVQLPNEGAFLTELVDSVPVLSESAFDAFARAVLDTSRLRKLIDVMRTAMTAAYHGVTDPKEFMQKVEREVIHIARSSSEGGFEHVKGVLKSVLNEWHDRAEGKIAAPGIRTGYDRFDQMTGGLHRGDLAIVAARPGMGKTAFIVGAAVNVAKRDEGTAIVSLEMPKKQLGTRMICSEAVLDLLRARDGRMAGNELVLATTAANALGKLGIYIDDAARGRPTVADICAKTRRLHSEMRHRGKKLSLLIVDYISLVKVREVLLRQRHDLAVGEVSTELKALAKELDIAVVALAQLNRGVESRVDKRPGLADLRDSGQIEQDGDLVAFLYRDDYYNPKTAEANIVEIIIEKQRNGPTGTAKMRFDGPTTRFINLHGGEFEDE